MPRLRSVLVLCLSCVCLSGLALAETLEEAEKNILAKWQQHNSLKANVRMQMKMEMPNGGKVTTDGAGTFEWVRSGELGLHRMELKSKMVTNVRDQQMAMEQEIVSVSDGATSTTLTTGMGRRAAMKDRVDVTQPTSTDSLFGTTREHFDYALMPDQEVDGAAAYVIEATPKKPLPRLPAKKVIYYLSKETGAIVGLAWLDDKGEQINRFEFTDIKLDEKIDPARFQLQIPEGVQVMDRTAAGSRPAGAGRKPAASAPASNP